MHAGLQHLEMYRKLLMLKGSKIKAQVLHTIMEGCMSGVGHHFIEDKFGI